MSNWIEAAAKACFRQAILDGSDPERFAEVICQFAPPQPLPADEPQPTEEEKTFTFSPSPLHQALGIAGTWKPVPKVAHRPSPQPEHVDIERLQAFHDSKTGGEWEAAGSCVYKKEVGLVRVAECSSPDTAEWMAEANNAMSALLAELRELREECRRLKYDLSDSRDVAEASIENEKRLHQQLAAARERERRLREMLLGSLKPANAVRGAVMWSKEEIDAALAASEPQNG